MVTLYKTDEVKNVKGKYLMSVELRGLSTDTKPTKINNTDIENGSAFIEIDTGTVYFYDKTSQTWKEI